jgi:two-component system response regulator YesN
MFVKMVRPPKFLVKLIVLSLLLGMLPVLGLGFFSYFKSKDITRQKVIEGNMSILLQTEMSVELLLKTIDNAATQFLTSYVVAVTRDQDLTYNHYQTFDELTTSMHHLQSYENGIQDVTLINLTHDWMINNKIMSSYSPISNKATIDKYIQAPQSSVWIREVEEAQIPSGMSVTKGVNLIKKIPISSQQPSGLFIAKLPGLEINKYLLTGNGLGVVMIFDADYRMLASNQEMESRAGDFSSAIQSGIKASGTDSGFFQTHMQDQWLGVTFRQSPYNGWTYVSIIPMVEITKESQTIGWLTLWICVGMMLVIVGISIVASRRMYDPIRQLVASVLTLPGNMLEDEADRDELQFIGERIHHMKVTQLNLENENQEHLRFLRESFILKLLKGYVKQSDIRERLALYGFHMKWKRFNVISVQIDTLNETRYREQDMDLLLFAINNMVAELISAERRLTPIMVDEFQVTLVGSQLEDEQEIKQDLYEMSGHIQHTVKEVLGLAISLGISGSFQDFRDTPRAYQESIDALKYRMKLERESIMMIEDVKPEQRIMAIFPELIEAELIDAIKQTDAERADRCLDAFLAEVFSKDLNFRAYQMALVHLLIDLNRIVETYGETLGGLYEDEKTLFGTLFDLKTVKEIKLWFQQSIIAPIILLIEQRRESQYQKISSQMLAMIHELYPTDITLESCGAALNYHPNYLKRVFRSETNMNFSDYLTDYRMTLAKKWLMETDMKVIDIAEKVGYRSPQNFIRSFRRIEGQTPGQYRESRV